MAGEVVNVVVNETTLFNITITDDSNTAVTVQVPNEIATIETSVIDAVLDLVNVGTGSELYASKAGNVFSIRSLKDDDKTIELTLQNTQQEIGIKLPDAGISTPDNFTINADSDSSANIKLVGGSVDLSKAKLITDLDANSKDLDNVGTITATNITTTDLTVSDDLTLTDNLTIGGTAAVTGDLQMGSTMSVYGTATFAGDISQQSGNTATLPVLNTTTLSASSSTLTTVDINNGTIDNTTIGATGSSTGRFTTVGTTSLTADTADLNGGTIDDMTIGATTPSTIVTTDLTATTVDINAGTIDNTVIGATTPVAVTTSSLVATTADINAGTIDNTVIGATTPVAGTFTTATATTGAITTVNSTTVNATTVDINGGTIDGTTIGGSTSAVGTFSTMNSANAIITGGDISGADIDLSGQSITFQNDNISGDAIHGGTISNFASTGIDDNADQTVLTLGADEVAAFAGAVTIAGNLTVSGTETTVNTETINLADNNIVLNSNETGTPSQNGGITIERGTSANSSWVWDETNDYWTAEAGSVGKIGGNTIIDTANYIRGTSFEATGTGSGTFPILVSPDARLTGGDITGLDTFSMASGGTFTAPTVTASTVVNTPKIQPTSTPNDDNFTLEALDFIVDARILHSGTDSTNANIANFLDTRATQLKVGSWTSGDRGITDSSNSLSLNFEVSAGSSSPETKMRQLRADDNVYLAQNSGHVHLGSLAASSYSDANQLGRTTINPANLVMAGGTITNTGDIIPKVDNDASLGSATKQWKEVFVGPGSLYIDGHKVLGSDDTGTINISTDTGQTLDIFAGGGSGTAGAVNIASRSNVTNLNDTTVNLGPSVGGATINARGTLEAPDLHNGDLEFSGTLINQTGTNQNLEIRTNGTGYLHANVADLYVGPLTGAVKIDENSISVTNTNGDLNLVSNGTGTVNIDDFEISHYSQFGENFGKIKATGTDQNLCLEASNGTGYFVVKSPNQYFGAASGVKITNAAGSATTLSGFGFQSEGLNITGNLSGNLTANATTENLTTKNVKANPTSLTIPVAPNMGNWNYSADTGHALVGIGKFLTGHPIVGITQTDNVNESQPKAMFLVNHMDYDHSGSGSALGGHGVSVDFNVQDEAGNLHQLAQNLVKLRNVTTGGSSGSSTITGYDSEYTLSVKKYGEAGPTNSLTSNKDFTEVAEELRVVNKAVNSGSTDLSGVYLTYDGAETGVPSAILQLRKQSDDSNVQNIKLEEARTTFGTVTKQYKASSDPSGEAGDTYFNTTTNKFRGHNGTAWVDLS